MGFARAPSTTSLFRGPLKIRPTAVLLRSISPLIGSMLRLQSSC